MLIYLIFIIPFFFVLNWLSIDTIYPTTDVAQYWSVSVLLKKSYDTNGFFSLVHDLYFLRSHKPILHSVIAFFFYALSGDDVLKARVYFSIFYFSLYCLYIALIGKCFLKGIKLALWCLFLSSFTWVFLNTHDITTEICYITYGTAFLYHLLCSKFFTDNKHTAFAGLFLFLIFCNRPESVAVFVPMAIAYYTHCQSNKKFKKNTFAISIVFGVLGLIHPLWQIIQNRHINLESLPDLDFSFYQYLPTLLFIASVTMVLKYRKKLKADFLPVAFIGGVIAAVSLWYGPFILSMYAWARYSSFSDFLANGSHRSYNYSERVTALKFLILLYSSYGSYFFSILLAGTLLAKPWKTFSQLHSKYKLSKTTKLFVVITITLLPLTGSITYSDDQRYFIFNILMIYGSVTALLLYPDKPLYYVRLTLLFILCLIQTVANSQVTYGNWPMDHVFFRYFLNIPEPLLVPITPIAMKDINRQLLDIAQEELNKIPSEQRKRLRIHYRTHYYKNVPRLKFYYSLFDSNVLTLLQQKYNFHISVDFNEALKATDPHLMKNIFSKKTQNADFLLLGPFETDFNFNDPNETSGLHKVFKAMQAENFSSPHYRLLTKKVIHHMADYDLTFVLIQLKDQ